MARVTLTIDAENAADLQAELNDLARGGVHHRLADAEPAQQPVQDWPQNEQPAPEPEQPKKRKRRTKAEIEAEKKAEAEAEKQPGGEPANDETSPTEVAAEKQPEPAPAKEYTIDDVKTVMQRLMDAKCIEPIFATLKDLGAVNEEKQPKVTKLDPAKYGEAIERMEAAEAEHAANAESSQGVLG